LPPFVEVASAWYEEPSGSLAMVQRPDQGVLAGFWELPQADVPHGVDPRAGLAAVLAAFGATRIELGDELGQVEHGMFNRRARLTAYAARMSWKEDARMCVMTRDELLQRPLTTSSRKLIRAVELATSAYARGVRRSPRP
jgi:adenine-specific DNA glycosylase